MSVASAIPTGTWTLALRQRFRLPATTMPVRLNRHLPSAVMQFPGPSFTKGTAHGACLPSGYGPVFESATRWPCVAISGVRDPVAEASAQMSWSKRMARRLTPRVVAFTQRTVRALLHGPFDSEDVTTKAGRNVLAATATLQGLSHEELETNELEYLHPGYPVISAARAIETGRTAQRSPRI